MRHAIALAVLLACGGCAHDQFMTYEQPWTPDPQHSATTQATKECGGPWQSWSAETITSRWPYRIETTETMRCLRDGRVVGPYNYREDDL